MRLSIRRIGIPLAGIAVALIALVAWQSVLADAGNPITSSIHGEIVVNANGTATVFVRGEWNWLSHNKDCNVDRNGTGAGMVWNDPSEPGYTVAKGAVSAGVGISVLRANNNDDGATGTVPANTIDRMVHPVDRGNQATDTYKDQNGVTQHDTNAPQPGPLNQQFVDPFPPGITTTQLAQWRGGCGRVPITTPCGINNDAVGDPCGSWGYEKVYTASDGTVHQGYAHTYASRKDITTVCANFYDVHGANAGFQSPNGIKEITVNGNGDNSIQTNAFNVTNGANCISFPQSHALPIKRAEQPKGTLTPSVSAGDPIGFSIYVPNDVATAATGVQLDDDLPSGPGIDWSIDVQTDTCVITGSPPTEHLHCDVGTIAGNTTTEQFVVHVTSPTQFTNTGGTVINSCLGGNGAGSYDNTVKLTVTSQDYQPEATANVKVLCPDLHITKTPTNANVTAGDPIGFKIHIENLLPAPGTAKAVTLTDALPVCPAKFNCSWSIVSVTGSGGKVVPANACSITPLTGPGAQTLSCSFGDLAPGQDVEVVLTSPTTFDGSACLGATTLNNPVALGTATNHPPVTTSAGVALECPSTTLDKTIDKIHVDYFIADTNDGNVSLSNPGVSDPVCENSSPQSIPTYVSGDTNGNGKLDPAGPNNIPPAETWTFKCTATFNGSTGVKTNTAIAHGTTPSGKDVTYCTTPPNSTTLCDPDERDSATVTVP